MSKPLAMARRAYQRAVPSAVRDAQFVKQLKSKILSHDTIYDAEFFDLREPAVLLSAGHIAASIMTEFAPARVLDVGCGSGSLLLALRDRGCGSVRGLEYAEAGLAFCRERGLDVAKFDLEHDSFELDDQVDVVVSLEVAEHLPESAAERYVDLVAGAAPIAVFSAAPPGQEGADHINLQPPAYWHAKFEQRGFTLDPATTTRFTGDWAASGEVQDWYCTNLMIFRRDR